MQHSRHFLLMFLSLLFLLIPPAAAISAPQKPTVSADTTTFDENTGRYHLTGHVTVIFDNRITQMDDAQVSATELEIWGQGNVQMHVGDDIYFTADAVCLEGFTPAAVLFGRVALQHPGLIIRAESASCNWNEHTVTFYGHVVCIEKGKETVAETLTYDMEENRIT